MIYLDNAATSYPKPEKVYEEINKCMREYCANPGRGGHAMSLESGKAVMASRDVISKFFNIKNPVQLCFTKNATEALNVAIYGCLKPGDHVVATSMEHNAVVRPLRTLEKNIGIELSFIKGNEFGEIDIESIKKYIKPNTKLMISTLSSNVNGITMPVREIGRIAREHGVLFLLDGSQGAGSLKINIEDMFIDMLAFPGHKGMLGPQGTGGLYIGEGLKINPLMQGGTGSNSEYELQPDIMPDSLESGTLNTPGIVGLGSGVEFINSFGIENIKSYKYMLTKRLYEGIEEIKGIKMYSRNDPENNSGIVAINYNGIESTEISYVLDRAYGIATRAGLHCAPLAHSTLGTINNGIVRLSIGSFNTIDEIDKTLEALREISENV